MSTIYLKKNNHFPSEILLPASKSISNRLLILNKFLGNKLIIENLSEADDTVLLRKILSNLCVEKPYYSFDLKNSGTSLRFLTAYLSQKEGVFDLLCNNRMQNRPINSLVDALRNLGADIQYLKNENYPPLRIIGKRLEARKIFVDINQSSQFATAVAMLSQSFDKGLHITVNRQNPSFSYFEMTIKLMQELGIHCNSDKNDFIIKKHILRESQKYKVEADWSASAVWFSFISLIKNSKIKLLNLHEESLQSDKKLIKIYSQLGIKTVFEPDGLLIYNSQSELPDFLDLDLSDNIDLAPTIAINLCLLRIKYRIRGIKNLKIKESDRLNAIRYNLKIYGFTTNNLNDEILEWNGKYQKQYNLKTFNSFDDHRIAMACSLFSVKEAIRIINYKCVDKSYPDFFHAFL